MFFVSKRRSAAACALPYFCVGNYTLHFLYNAIQSFFLFFLSYSKKNKVVNNKKNAFYKALPL